MYNPKDYFIKSARKSYRVIYSDLINIEYTRQINCHMACTKHLGYKRLTLEAVKEVFK